MPVTTTPPVSATAAPGPVLRDIHLPPDPLWWPPAPGWWILGLVVLLMLVVVWWAGRHYQTRRRHRQQLITELDQLASSYTRDRNSAALAGGVHQLLRRVARRHDPTATQQRGQAWRETLARVPVDAATLHQLLALDDAIYREQSNLDVTATVSAARRWLQRASSARSWKPIVEGARRA
ncbi:MAG: DUF4381 domain-containing protein [Rhodanobacter sp.]